MTAKGKTTEKNATTEEQDLLQELAGEGEDIDDLLGEVEEDDSEGWVPEKEGEGLQGICLKRSTVMSEDFGQGKQECPVVHLEDQNGDRWRVIGYSTVLRRLIEDDDPQPGDLWAVKYFGKRKQRKGSNEYHNYGSAVRRGVRPDLVKAQASE